MDMTSSFACRLFEQSGRRHPRELNIMPMVSDETHDRTIADSVRPSAENSDTTARSDRMVASGVSGRVCVRVVDMGDLLSLGEWKRRATKWGADLPEWTWLTSLSAHRIVLQEGSLPPW